MGRYMLARLAQSVALIIFVSIVTFGLIHAAPGGPAILMAPEMTKEQIKEAQKSLGLDQPIPVQYARWLGNLMRGSLGTSYNQGLPVSQLISRRLPETMELVFAGLFVAVVAGVAVGIISAKKQYSLIDHLSTGFTFFGMSVPVFWMGLMLIIVFSINLQWLPSAGSYTLGVAASAQDRLSHLRHPPGQPFAQMAQ